MITFLRRHREALIVYLSLALLSAVVALLFKRGLISREILRQNKDTILAASSLVNTLLLIIAALLSYFRFFHGRTFSSRAELEVEATVYDTTEDFRLHSVVVDVKNVGSAPIWDPKITVTPHPHGPPSDKLILGQWQPQAMTDDCVSRAQVIDSGETASFFAQLHVAKLAWATTYVVQLDSRSKDRWQKVVTVSNEFAAGGGEKALNPAAQADG